MDSAGNDDDVEGLVVAAAAGDQASWRERWSAVEPGLLALVRKPRISEALSRSEDDCRNIVTDVMARLGAEDQRRSERCLALRRHFRKPEAEGDREP